MFSRPQTIRNTILRGMVGAVAGLAVCGWILSWLHIIGSLAIVTAVAIIVFSVLWTSRAIKAWPDFYEGVLKPLSFRPFVALVCLALLAAFIYPPTMLDSLTYRIPRMWLWLQDHSIQSYGSTNARIDYMPQTWGLATIPFLQAFGDKLVWFWTFCAWLALYLAVYDLSLNINQNVKKSQQMAFLIGASTFAVLQATSSANDLFAGTALMLALHFISNFERSRDWREIHWAVLSFAIACGTKLHYAVFGLPLVLWFFLSPSKPWRLFPLKWAPPLLAVWVLCSPVPSFIMNENSSGSWAGADYKRLKGSPVWNAAVGTAMFLWQTPQPPINPAAITLKSKLEAYSAKSPIRQHVPKFTLAIFPAALPDGAGLGLITSCAMLGGAAVALRRRRVKLNSLPIWAAVAAGSLLIIAVSKYVPGGVARTYGSFLFLTLPLIVVGWNVFSESTLKWACWLSLLSGISALVMDPSRPLWPAQTLLHFAEKSPKHSHVVGLLKTYTEFTDRAHLGEELVNAIPPNEPQVLILCDEDQPLLPFFRPYSLGRDVILIPVHSSPEKLDEEGINYVIVGAGGREYYPEICGFLQQRTNLFQPAMTRPYISKLSDGPKEWTLYQRLKTSKGTAN